MQIILLQKINKLGNLGDKVNVKSGYARNFLFPKGKAILATKKNIEHFEKRRNELQSQLVEALNTARDRAEKINILGSITIPSKSRDGGKLFGSINARDIANAITTSGIKVEKREVYLQNGVIRTTGIHEVTLRFHNEIFTKLLVNVI